MTKDYITIALSKGNLLGASLEILQKAGLPVDEVSENSRSMVFTYEQKEPFIKYIICRPTDVPVYVERGAADLGIAGKDVIEEQGKDVFEMVDLKFGSCRFVIAAPRSSADMQLQDMNYKRVATKFPHLAERFFRSRGLQVEIIKLHGNIELAPLMGLADVIVDLVSTGRTLKENDLVELENIMDSSARLISNRVSYRTRHGQIQNIIDTLQEIVERS